MNSISHKQAIQFIDRRMDEMLDENQQTLLDEHLHSCDSCRAYSNEMESMPADLKHEFHLRWDSHPELSERFTERVVSKAKRVSIRNNFTLGMRWLAGAIALILLALVINLVVSQLQHISPSTTNTATAVPTQNSNTFPQNDSGFVAFSSIQNGNSEIYIMHGDGSGLTNITNNPADDSNPNWSPDGQHIAFVSDRDGTAQIYLMDADGSNITQLTHNQSEHYLSINVDNKYTPWSPDGSKILSIEYSSDNELWNLYEIGVDGQNQTLLASNNQYFTSVSWSPDAKYVALAFNDSPDPTVSFVPDIYVFAADGSNGWELKTLIPQNETLDLPYYWSSDGKSIIFVADQEDRKHQTVYEFNFLTNSLTQIAMQKSRVVDWQTDTALIFDTEKAMPTFIWQKSDGRSNTQELDLRNCLFDFTKSSHGNLAVGGFCNDTDKFQLYWTNTDGSASKLLYESGVFGDTYQMADITWSPDDRYVTFMLGSDVQTHLYILNVQKALNDPSSQPMKIEIGADQMHAIPSWQPTP